jgi:hypothetical protein
MRCRRIALCWVVSVLAALFTGCGGDPLGRQPISGSVSLEGAPLEKGTINFHPVDTAKTSTGGPIAGGKFEFERQKGLAVGKYRVTINAPKPGTGQEAPANTMPGDPLPVPVELVPPEWNTNSAQFVEVNDSGKNEFNFDIKSKAK